jgi:hypothetical protein
VRDDSVGRLRKDRVPVFDCNLVRVYYEVASPISFEAEIQQLNIIQ